MGIRDWAVMMMVVVVLALGNAVGADIDLVVVAGPLYVARS